MMILLTALMFFLLPWIVLSVPEPHYTLRRLKR